MPDGSTKFVIVAGQPIEMGEEACMLFTFADLERRRKAESALKQSEERFAKAFRLSPVPTVLARLADLTYLAVNDAFTTGFGVEEADVLGKTATELRLWVNAEGLANFHRALADSGHVRNFEASFKRRDGTEIDCMISAELVTINDEVCILSVMLDVTERKRGERELMAAIEAVMADTSWFSRGVIERLAALRPAGRASVGNALNLSTRERQVLSLMCEGLSDAAIGQRLSVSTNTARNHVAALYRKLGLHRRSDVVIWGRERGFPVAIEKTTVR